MARLIERRAASITATMAICASLLLAVAGASAAPAAAAAGVSADTVAATTVPAAPPGSNLLLNPAAGAGDTSKLGWDAVTIPGWQDSQGLPTVVSYGTKRFPGASGAQPPGHPARLFAGGAGGTALLTQQVPPRGAAAHGVPPGTSDHLSARLGGTVVSKASLEVIFLSATGKALGKR